VRSLTIRETHIGIYRIETRRNRKGPDSHIVRSKDPTNPRAFTLREETPGKWNVSESIAIGKRRRERFLSPDLSSAVFAAEEILFGRLTAKRKTDILEVSAAFERWLEISQAKPRTKEDYSNYIEIFLEWLGAKYPRVNLWSHVRLEHLQKFTHHLQAKDKAGNTIRLYCLPIRATARYLAANWPEKYHDFSRGFRLPMEKTKGCLVESSRIQFLPLAEAVNFLVWLRSQQNGWGILPGVTLQVLMALRVLEVVRLRWDRVDLEAGTVTVEGEVKNRFSIRRLPAPAYVQEVLKESPRNGEHVVDPIKDWRVYAGAITKALATWDKRFSITAKDLRKTIPTTALDEGWGGPVLERFLGHSPQTITTRHYFGDSADRMLDLFRRQVTDRIDALLEKHLVIRGATRAQSQSGKNESFPLEIVSPMESTVKMVGATGFEPV